MPHIHLETTDGLSENANLHEIVERLAKELSGYPTVGSESVKVYHTLRTVWATGEGATPGFVHCTVLVLTGRPLELRKQIAGGIYSVLRELFSASVEAGQAAITLELREMERETYLK